MAKGQKKKREKISKMPNHQLPYDPMDDNERKQVEPREEPPEDKQHEPWDDKWERGGPETRSDSRPANDKNNGEE